MSLQVSMQPLPPRLTSFVGREQDIQEACALLGKPDVRLLTLTGPGGIGKTRLSLQIAAQVRDDFRDGVFFVALSAISDPALVIPTIAQTLNIRESGDQSLLDVLKTALREKSLLLLLDNFEQVVSAAPSLTQFIAACPSLKVLVTSRVVLHVQGEYEFAVLPLPLPNLKRLPEPEALSQCAAVALFLQRARTARPGFQLSTVNARTIAEICVRLDGLPLAIELAAARIKLLPPEALLERLSHRLTVLTSQIQDLPERQQTLRSTIAWSYDLLSGEEQRLFQRLSVFVGGCTLEAAETFSASLGDTGVSTFDGISSLLDKSLLQQTEEEGTEPRLRYLETIREFGLECLSSSGEETVARNAHAAYYLRLAELAEPELVRPQQITWLERLAHEHDNLRAALQWWSDQGAHSQDYERAQEMALRMCGALWQFWRVHGHYSEGRSFLERALAASKGSKTPARAKALIAAASLAFFQNDYERNAVLCEESLALYQELGDKRGIAHSRYLMGGIAWKRAEFASARTLFEGAAILFEQVGDQERTAWALFYLARVYATQGEYAQARALLEKSLAMQRGIMNKRGISSALFQLAHVLFFSQDNPTIVRSLLSEALTIFRELNHKAGIADCLSLAGQLALHQGDRSTARAQLEESVLLFREIGDRQSTAWSLSLLGSLEAAEGSFDTASSLCEESLAVVRDVGDKEYIPFYLERLASVVAVQGKASWAARLWSTAEALRGATGTPLPPVERSAYEHSVATIRAALGEKTFASQWAQGRAMTLEQVLAAQETGVLPQSSSEASQALPSKKSSTMYPARLTAREVEVLRLVAQGLTDAQVAAQLIVTPRTINFHLTSIYGKIGVSSRAAATRYAVEHGLA